MLTRAVLAKMLSPATDEETRIALAELLCRIGLNEDGASFEELRSFTEGDRLTNTLAAAVRAHMLSTTDADVALLQDGLEKSETSRYTTLWFRSLAIVNSLEASEKATLRDFAGKTIGSPAFGQVMHAAACTPAGRAHLAAKCSAIPITASTGRAC